MTVTARARGHLKSLTLIYLTGMAFFSLFRALLVLTNLSSLQQVGDGKWELLGRAMLMGLRFDTVISCYILALPVLVLSLSYLTGYVSRRMLTANYVWVGVLYILSFLICSIDIPFFQQFFNRLNDTVLNWASHASFGFRMVVEEPKFLGFLGLFLLLGAVYLWILKRVWRRHQVYAQPGFEPMPAKQLMRLLPFVLTIWGALFLGIRGRTAAKTPIVTGTAFFSNNPFINQLGLNPVFSFIRSSLDNLQPDNSRFQELSDAEALNRMGQLLHGEPQLADISPIARYQRSDAPLEGRNIVLVLMESMAAAKMGRFGNDAGLTPFLDSLAAQSWSFDRTYSSGIHTYNGIYSTLFAHPAIMKRHSMEQVVVPRMAGFPNTLARAGYQNIFFTTHDEMFDNMSGFLSANEVSTIVGQKDYPAEEVLSTLGVPDEYMFSFSIERLNQLAAQGKPFFAAYMTGSDHDPVVIPEGTGFSRRHADDKQAIVAYADWSLRRFMEYASRQAWYRNTVFVFVADHGAAMGPNPYDILFSYHHIPFIVFAPGFTGPRAIDALGLQTDVFPTVAGLVLPSFINNSFGINLLRDRRPYVVFSADDKLACMSDSLLYIHRVHASPSLYRYRNGDLTDYAARLKDSAELMQRTAFSWLQTSEWMLVEGKTTLGETAKSR